jgi:hypothetical protein
MTSPGSHTPEFRFVAVGRHGLGRAQKLTDGQIADRSTWGRVPETDMIKAASHSIRSVPAGSTTITLFNELDPGISGETVGEGRGWSEPPRGYGPVQAHGRVTR